MRRTAVCCSSFGPPNFKGIQINQITGTGSLLGKLNVAKRSTQVKGLGRKDGNGRQTLKWVGRAFAEDATGHSVTAGFLTHEFKLQHQVNRGQMGGANLDRALQHLIVSLQRQLDYNGRRDPPQRTIGAQCFLRGTKKENLHHEVATAQWREHYKVMDTGYYDKDASLINENRDEVLFRIRKHFEKKRVTLRFDQFTEEPPGFTCTMQWDAEDDDVVLTPEGKPVMVPRVDQVQRIRTDSSVGVGLGPHQGGM
eukprot:Rhum_TRINITY_DN3223_c0_g1::Rhum_TRINITY_DN3223_c0_g1_i1::g.10052::m.10052